MTPEEYWKVAVVEEGVPDELATARMVSYTNRGPNEDGLTKLYRTLKEEDYKRFLAELRALERDYRLIKAAGQKAKGVSNTDTLEADVGTQKCLGLAEALVKELTDAS